MFSCSIVISDHRAHTLDDSAGRKIEEGLKLVINAQNYHIALGVNSKQAVQHGDQKGGGAQYSELPELPQHKVFCPCCCLVSDMFS